MDIELSVDAFRQAFASAGPAVAGKSPRVVYQSLRLEALDGRATMTGCDGFLTLTAGVPVAAVEARGVVLLPKDRLTQILAGGRPGDRLRVRVKERKVEIKLGRARYGLTHQDPDEYPAPPAFPAGDHFEFDGKALAATLDALAPMTDPASTRYALGGVNLARQGERLRFAATDGRQLGAIDLDVSRIGAPILPYETALGGTLPTRAMKLIATLARHAEEPVKLAFTAGQYAFATADATLTGPLCEGRFPEFMLVFPAHEPAATIGFNDPTDLIECLRQARPMTTADSKGIMIEADGTGVTAWAMSPDIGSSRVDLEWVAEGASYCVVDPTYLENILRPMAGREDARVQLYGPKEPVVVKAAGYLGFMACMESSLQPSRVAALSAPAA